jgi:hypothetical protein
MLFYKTYKSDNKLFIKIKTIIIMNKLELQKPL